MLLSEFMIPKEKVVTCVETDEISKIIHDIMKFHISCVVVLNHENTNHPVGIVTKTDLVRAYQQGISLRNPVSTIMTTQDHLFTLLDTTTRDNAAKFFEKKQNHHAIVVNKEQHFVGVVSAWDIASEVAKDSRSWPWHRNQFGRFAVSH